MINELTGKLEAMEGEIAVIDMIADRLADDETRRGESVTLDQVVKNLKALHLAIEILGQEIYGESRREEERGENVE